MSEAPKLSVVPPAKGGMPAFWASRPLLTELWKFARSREVAPIAMLGAVLAKASSCIPPTTVLPPIIGGTVGLQLFVGIVGHSGAGKSSAVKAASDFLEPIGGVPYHPVSVGTGEGLLNTFVKWKYIEPKKQWEQTQLRHGAMVSVDEVTQLVKLGERKGQTLMSHLTVMWMGVADGTNNAERDRNRQVWDHTYALSVVCGIQPHLAGVILDDTDSGLAQRWLWIDAYDPDPPDTAQKLRKSFRWAVPTGPLSPMRWMPRDVTNDPREPRQVMQIPDEVRDLILANKRKANRAITADEDDDVIASHRLLNQEKVAAILAHLDGRHQAFNLEDWELAGQVMEWSAETRDQVEQVRKRRNGQEDRLRAVGTAKLAVVADEAQAQAAEQHRINRITAKLRVGGPMFRTTLLKQLADSTRRPLYASTLDDHMGDRWGEDAEGRVVLA